MLPTFLVIGAMKSGTTSLHAYLAAHPQIFMAEPKELHFFSIRENWERGQRSYEECFAAAGTSVARGEVSPSYSQADIFPGVASRVAAMLPDIKLVYILRHPIERMRSMYLHQLASGRERRPIADAFRSSAYYLNSSRYAWQLDQYLEHLAPDRVRVVTIDALRDEPNTTLAELYEFVGADPATTPGAEVRRGLTEDKRVASPLKRRVSRLPGFEALRRVVPQPLRPVLWRATTRPVVAAMAALPLDLEAELAEQLRPDLARLRSFLGSDFDGWGMLNPSGS